MTFWEFYLLAGATTLCACLLYDQQRARHGLATGKYGRGHLAVSAFIIVVAWPIALPWVAILILFRALFR